MFDRNEQEVKVLSINSQSNQEESINFEKDLKQL